MLIFRRMESITSFHTSGLERYDAEISRAAVRLERVAVIPRIWKKDALVWKDKDVEISDRLGWLEAPDQAARLLPGIDRFAGEVRAAGIEHALLLGMGGSSLAPEVFSRVFGTKPGFLTLDALDSTDPEAVLGFAQALPCDKTVYIASSKSGTTLETTSFLNFFHTRALGLLGKERAGEHFAAVTDPGTPLERTAKDLGFRRVFYGDPDIGGRFSVLSAFGLLPAALLGVDVAGLLDRARRAAGECRIAAPRENPGAMLGTILGVLAAAGRDKIVFLLSPEIESFGAWLEQLLAESTGKEGCGILPLVRDAKAAGDRDFPDRYVIHIGLAGNRAHDEILRTVRARGTPLLSFTLNGIQDLGRQFFLWEMATAVAGSILKINPFDQPNVAASKKKTEAVLGASKGNDISFEIEPAEEDHLRPFLNGAKPGDYIVVQAFLPPQPEIRARLAEFSAALRERTDLAVAFDFGPRFLHSTGQLHKGDRGNGLFIQLTGGHARDIDVPAEPRSLSSDYSFGGLIDAQARGDREALRDKGRRLIHFHFPDRPADGIRRLMESL